MELVFLGNATMLSPLGKGDGLVRPLATLNTTSGSATHNSYTGCISSNGKRQGSQLREAPSLY